VWTNLPHRLRHFGLEIVREEVKAVEPRYLFSRKEPPMLHFTTTSVSKEPSMNAFSIHHGGV